MLHTCDSPIKFFFDYGMESDQIWHAYVLILNSVSQEWDDVALSFSPP